MSEARKLDDIFAYCVMEETSLLEVWADIESSLCSRNKRVPPKIMIDFSHLLFRNHGFEIELFIDHLQSGVFADAINDGGRVAIVIGTQQNVCVCGELELLDALAELAQGSDAIHIMPTTSQAYAWLTAQGGTAATTAAS